MSRRRLLAGIMAGVAMAGLMLTSCGDDEDSTPPSAIADLVGGSPTAQSVTLTWTAPGDDEAMGIAAAYDVRYSKVPLTESNWQQAQHAFWLLLVNGLYWTDCMVPWPAGQPESFTVTGLDSYTTYYFGVKTRDEVDGQWSGLSNVVVARTLTSVAPVGLVLLSPGTFTMGSPVGERGRLEDEVQHTVRLTRPFYLSVHEVTQREWVAVMGTNPSAYTVDQNLPVESVSWYDAVSYCNALSGLERLTPAYTVDGTTVTWDVNAEGYRLPTEAEWEYACRAGWQRDGAPNSTWGYFGPCDFHPRGDYLDLMTWSACNSEGRTHWVGGRPANCWGLHDMQGNVSEWCWDWSGDYGGDVTDPQGPPAGSDGRIVRGGSYANSTKYCRFASRSSVCPDCRGRALGFRLARSVP